MSFAHKIIAWYKREGRMLPWRTTTDPYVIWLSEIILQQTRVEQGLPYFQKFVAEFPTVQKFAAASEDKVLRLWQGLGYYSRARNMHKAAKLIISDFEGVFPSSYSEAIKLPGVGKYTASAISSFAANEVQAVVDGNVYRVLSRIFGIDTPINSPAGEKEFQAIADSLIDRENPGLFNHAIMDFGAIHCKPKLPLCDTCIFEDECVAQLKGIVDTLPVKTKGKKSRNRYFHYFLIHDGECTLVSKREAGDVWTNLYEFPMIETETKVNADDLVELEEFKSYFGDHTPIQIGKEIKHILSHQNIFATFYLLPEKTSVRNKKSHWNYILSKNLDKLAKHKLIFSFLEEYELTDGS